MVIVNPVIGIDICNSALEAHKNPQPKKAIRCNDDNFAQTLEKWKKIVEEEEE